MRNDPLLLHPGYTPERLLEQVMLVLSAENRSQLAFVLEVDISMISRAWNRKDPVSEYLMVQIMDRTGWGVQYVRELMGVPYDGKVFPPLPRIIVPPKGRVYHTAKADILQSMPGTATELAKRAGYHREWIYIWLRKLRKGDPLTRESHIIGWVAPSGPNGSGDYTPIHAAGPGEDAPRIKLPRPRRRAEPRVMEGAA